MSKDKLKLKVIKCTHRPGKFDIINEDDPNGRLVGCFYNEKVALELMIARNSHDALVEALEAAGRYHQGFNEEIGLKIRAALASIKEAK